MKGNERRKIATIRRRKKNKLEVDVKIFLFVHKRLNIDGRKGQTRKRRPVD